jgi:septum formation topological specificity factor MinE
MRIDFKNLAENLLIAIVVAAVASTLTYYAVSKTASKISEQTIQGLRPALIEAIKKETTAIKNDIKVQVDKIKKSDSLNININQIPENELNQTLKKEKLIPDGYILIKKENLTRRQKKRLGLN